MSLHVYLFGGLRLESEARPLPPIPSRAGRSLFAYLITHRSQPHTRELLAGLFWPDMSEAQARRRLSHALWQVRHVVDANADIEPYILADAEMVQINNEASLWLDADDFEQKLNEVGDVEGQAPERAISSLQAAAALYTGDLLAGYYDDWIALERERLRGRYLNALERLVRLCKAQGDHETALTYARQLTLQDPLREQAHREVMRLCYLLGRPNEALQQYELCAELLAEELGAEPGATTTALYQEISARKEQEAAHRRPTPAAPSFEGAGGVPFVGRQKERAALVRAVEQALGGRGGIALLEGEPGVGKTRLLREIGEDADWRGVQVLRGQGRELTEHSPYSAIREALEGSLSPLRAGQLGELVDGVWLRDVSQIVPQLAEWLPDLPPRAALKPEDEHSRLLEALAQVLLSLEKIAPHLLILDDLQWADEGTLDVLRQLAPRLLARHMLLIVAYRGEEARARAAVWDTLRALDQAEGSERWLLPPLSAAETAELVQRGLGLASPAPRFEARLSRESGGNPLFVLETLRALREEGLLFQDDTGAWNTPWDDATSDYAELPLAPALREVIAGRLARLAPEIQSTLNAAAVLEEDFDVPLLLRTCETEKVIVFSAVDDLLRRGLLVEGRAAYRFSHDQIRQVAYDAIPARERRRLHRRAGEALAARDKEQAAALAQHFYKGALWNKAMRYYRQAGDQAVTVHAYKMAVEHYSQALSAAARARLTTGEHFELLAARESALDVLGRREAQAGDLDAMTRLAQTDPQQLGRALRRRAWLLAHTDVFDEAESAAREALALSKAAADESGQAEALVILGTICNWRGSVEQAIPYLQTAVEIQKGRAAAAGEAEARFRLGDAYLFTSAYAEARAELEQALALYETTGNRLGQADAFGLLGIIAMEQGDSETAIACYRRSREMCRAIGYRYGEARALGNLGNVHYVGSRIDEALQSYDGARVAFQAIGNRRGEALLQMNEASLLCNLIGDFDAATAYVEAALAYYREVGDADGVGHGLDIMATIARRRGVLGAARRYLEESLDCLQPGSDQWLAVQRYRNMAVLILDEGHPADALNYLDKCEAICRELDMGDLLVPVLGVRASALLAAQQPQEALAAADEALQRLTPGTEQPYLAYFIYHKALTALGRRQPAREALEQAYELLTKMLVGLSPGQHALSLERIREHRDILATWKAVQPQRTTMRLPRADAPTGRPLRDHEWVEVTWTVAAPEDEAVAGKTRPERSRRKARRQRRLLRLLQEAAEQGAAPTVNDLAAALDVSPKTIKRDLGDLRQAGRAVRTRGTRTNPKP